MRVERREKNAFCFCACVCRYLYSICIRMYGICVRQQAYYTNHIDKFILLCRCNTRKYRILLVHSCSRYSDNEKKKLITNILNASVSNEFWFFVDDRSRALQMGNDEKKELKKQPLLRGILWADSIHLIEGFFLVFSFVCRIIHITWNIREMCVYKQWQSRRWQIWLQMIAKWKSCKIQNSIGHATVARGRFIIAQI